MITSLTTTNDWITLEAYLNQDTDIEFPVEIEATIINTSEPVDGIAKIKRTKPLTSQAPIVDRGLRMNRNDSIKGIFNVKNTWIKSNEPDTPATLCVIFGSVEYQGDPVP